MSGTMRGVTNVRQICKHKPAHAKLAVTMATWLKKLLRDNVVRVREYSLY